MGRKYTTTARKQCELQEPEPGKDENSNIITRKFRKNVTAIGVQKTFYAVNKDLDVTAQHGPVRSLWCKEHKAMRAQCGCKE